jgi:hypothetical protein
MDKGRLKTNGKRGIQFYTGILSLSGLGSSRFFLQNEKKKDPLLSSFSLMMDGFFAADHTHTPFHAPHASFNVNGMHASIFLLRVSIYVTTPSIAALFGRNTQLLTVKSPGCSDTEYTMNARVIEVFTFLKAGNK